MTPFDRVDVGSCTPFSYASEPSTSGSRIGGHPPLNASSRFVDEFQRFFGTIEFIGGRAVTIFHSFDICGNDEQRDIISYNNRPLFPSKLIHAVVHETGAPSEKSAISAEVSCHEIVFETPRLDAEETNGSMPCGFSKIGGRPFVDNVSRVGEAFEQLVKMGFRQLIQFDTPNPQTHKFVNNFPWDPGWLHVLVRGADLGNCDFAFVIQQ